MDSNTLKKLKCDVVDRLNLLMSKLMLTRIDSVFIKAKLNHCYKTIDDLPLLELDVVHHLNFTNDEFVTFLNCLGCTTHTHELWTDSMELVACPEGYGVVKGYWRPQALKNFMVKQEEWKDVWGLKLTYINNHIQMENRSIIYTAEATLNGETYYSFSVAK